MNASPFALGTLLFAIAASEVLVAQQPAAPQKKAAGAQELLAPAQRLENERRPAEAIAAAERAVAALRSAHGDANAETLTALEWLAARYERRENFVQAQKLRSEILSATARLYGKGQWQVASARLALEDVKKLASLSPAQRQQLYVAEARQRDALALIDQGKYALAVGPAQEAVNIRRTILGQWHREYGESLCALGSAYIGLGDYARAEPSSRQAVEVIRGAYGVEHPATVTSVDRLADLYERMGDFTKADLLLSQALDINRKAYGDRAAATGESSSRLGSLYVAMRQFERADPLLKQGLTIVRSSPDIDVAVKAKAALGVGQLYLQTHQAKLAEPLLREAVELTEQRYGPNHPATASALGKLASVYGEFSDGLRAELFFQTALDIFRNTVGTSHPDYALHLKLLAELYESQGAYQKAEPLLAQSLDAAFRELDAAAAVQSERQQLAMAEEARRRLDAYLVLATRAPEYQESAYRKVLVWKGSVLARQSAISAVRDDPSVKLVYSELEKVVSELPRFAYAVPRPDQREYWQRKSAELSDKKERLERLLADKSRDLRRQRQAVTLDDVRTCLPADTVLIDVVESYAAVADPVVGGAAASPTTTRRNGTSVQPRGLAFVIRPHAPVELVVLDAPEAIGDYVERWRADMEADLRQRIAGQRPELPKAGQWLREHVWQPVEARIAGVKTVLISPDGMLGKLPFAALPGKSPDSYLIEELSLATIPAAQSLPQFARGSPIRRVPGKLLLFDAINEEDDDTPTAQSAVTTKKPRKHYGLPLGAESQSEVLRQLYEKNFSSAGLTVVDANVAKEEAFRREAPRNQYVHLIAHGFSGGTEARQLLNRPTYDNATAGTRRLIRSQSLADYNPNLLSGIFLAGGESPKHFGEDNRLYSIEIQTLDLRSAELVMLSSCETALGETAAGEGLLGIQRAFQIAGARTVVAALWKVQVMATSDLMARFYENLWNKHMTKLEALREAQLWMLRERGFAGVMPAVVVDKAKATGESQRLPPYYWAGFVLSGDWLGADASR